MTEPELEPLSALAAALLAEERRRPPADPREIDALWGRIGATLGPGGGGGGDSSGGGGAGGAATPGAGASALSARVLPWIGAAFLAGGGAGAALYARLGPKTERIVLVAAPPAAPPAVPPASAPEASIDAPASTRTPAPPPRAARTPPPDASDADPAARDNALAQEHALIERARMALARGDSTAVLDATGAHERASPSGRLREEREALAIRALAASGRLDAARARADRFHASYPKSLFGPALDAAVAPR